MAEKYHQGHLLFKYLELELRFLTLCVHNSPNEQSNRISDDIPLATIIGPEVSILKGQIYSPCL